jgi:hypothetical protein
MLKYGTFKQRLNPGNVENNSRELNGEKQIYTIKIYVHRS